MTHIAVDGCNDHCSDHEKPVGHGHIHLPMELIAGVNHLNLREIAHGRNLREELEGRRDYGL